MNRIPSLRSDRRRLGLAVAASLAVLAMTGCGGESGGTPSPTPPVAVTPATTPTPTSIPTPTPTSAASIERDILPASTDSTLVANLDPHVAINPSSAVAARGKLFVMLPGTGGIPGRSRLILRLGAARGWHAIGLTYPNGDGVGELCATSPDADCIARVRREIITGADASDRITMTPANSIAGRLTSLLRILDTRFPAEGWGRFLRAGAPDWSLITVAGHSQGSGHAAFLAKLVTLNRAALFSGPGEFGGASTPLPTRGATGD